jgi:hypothetical protein
MKRPYSHVILGREANGINLRGEKPQHNPKMCKAA